ncbi:---NA--- [Podarcis lilfordi]|uniref:---NA n=1 Tax=Podarcis lilfordi TaxID=74358 RepID=A0AA35K1T6_9SAUR|nr:---NA--- [Podarcis lilfordi]
MKQPQQVLQAAQSWTSPPKAPSSIASRDRRMPTGSLCLTRISPGTSCMQSIEFETLKKMFKGTVCGKCFSQNGILNVHQQSHIREKPFKCMECGKSFTKGLQLNIHL